MHTFVRNLITEWRRLELPVENATVVIGVSGGADSVSLLLAMRELVQTQKLDLRLVAAHFNHGLRAFESNADERFVKMLTAELKIESASEHSKSLATGNLEQNARRARYQFLSRVADGIGAFAILTGHTINDQAETFLMNLIRGSGRDGLCGMRAVRPLEEEKRGGGEKDTTPFPLFSSSPTLLVRPLLSWAKRQDTEQFCLDNGIEFRYDTMNDDTAFRRVQIRKILLPILEDMNPKIVETLANTATLMQNLETPGNRLALTDVLILGDLKMLSKSELNDAIRSWLRDRRGNTRRLQLKHVEAVERLIFSEKSGRIVELPGGKIVKSDGKIRYEQNKVEN